MSRKPCPTCRQPSTDKYSPFCSKRCADIDLQRWFSGAYAIPAEAEADGAASQTTDEED